MNTERQIRERMAKLSPLHIAVREGRLDKIREALRPRWFRRVPRDVLDAQDAYGATPLHYAVEGSEFETSRDLRLASARLLLEAGADPNIPDGPDGHTPLHSAAYCNLVDFAKLLLSNGADVHAHENPRSETPLHTAAWKYGHDVGPILLDAGADIDARDRLGQTALHYAVRKCRVEMIQVLLARGASRSVTDSENKRPVDYLELSAKKYAESEHLTQRIKELFDHAA